MPRLHNERLAKDVEGFECGPCAGTGAKALTASPAATVVLLLWLLRLLWLLKG